MQGGENKSKEERGGYTEYGKRSYDAVTAVQEVMGRGFESSWQEVLCLRDINMRLKHDK